MLFEWIYSDLNMHRLFRNIFKNASFALTYHFATADDMHANIFLHLTKS